jgi:hypothetical protein
MVLSSPYPGNLDPRLVRTVLSNRSLVFPVEVISVLLLLLLLYTVRYATSALKSFIIALNYELL